MCFGAETSLARQTLCLDCSPPRMQVLTSNCKTRECFLLSTAQNIVLGTPMAQDTRTGNPNIVSETSVVFHIPLPDVAYAVQPTRNPKSYSNPSILLTRRYKWYPTALSYDFITLISDVQIMFLFYKQHLQSACVSLCSFPTFMQTVSYFYLCGIITDSWKYLRYEIFTTTSQESYSCSFCSDKLALA